jgi:hypothetical protein
VEKSTSGESERRSIRNGLRGDECWRIETRGAQQVPKAQRQQMTAGVEKSTVLFFGWREK